MTRRYHRMKVVALAAVLGLVLAACSDEPGVHAGPSRELRLVLGSQDFSAVTRALPDGFSPYGNFYSTSLPENAQIQAYMTRDGVAESAIQALFSPVDEDGTRSWTSRIQMDDEDTYYLYGFMPKRAGNSVTITPLNRSYATGAVLTINGLDAITPDDVCVIVGVKGYTLPEGGTLPAISDDALEMDRRLGFFDINIQDVTNYAYLLVDHIYCGLHFRMKVDEAYAALRTIKVKRLKLLSGDGSATVKTIRADVTLVSGKEDYPDPLSSGAGGSVTITTQETGEAENPALLYDNAGSPRVLSTDYTSFDGFFAPSSVRRFILETTYDVYDRKGNLIREGQTASNTLTPATMSRGQQYTYDITVKPTYLYVLSDPDLDNPTFNLTE